ncbi:type II secretion system protein [Psychrobacter sp. I-STPA6b]|uniref:type II secretion system protein n=1 Tax=Psychrobacter sp. I-STPA6b TaxID=2585718 RepID=UPI001D0C30E9|nr:type II secretion system protein [Psychrobacter sp. I-STPA6b]
MYVLLLMDHKLPQRPSISSLHQQQKQSGFTLVEIMVVVVILSVFAGMMTLSVGSTEVRKNRAFYEHLIDSLQYVRLVSAEQMQPMGLALQSGHDGQTKPVILSLENPYEHLSYPVASNGDQPKNMMELSAMNTEGESQKPTWQLEKSISLPELPPDVVLKISPLSEQAASQQPLQPWFLGTDVPSALWYGTGEASPVTIEVRYHGRLVGEVITVMPNGHIQVGQS